MTWYDIMIMIAVDDYFATAVWTTHLNSEC